MANLRSKRESAFHEQHGRCIYCGGRMWLKSPTEMAPLNPRRVRQCQATAEHLIARCEGGTDAFVNIAAACLYCNQHRHRAKRPLSVPAYQARVRRRMAAGRWHSFHG